MVLVDAELLGVCSISSVLPGQMPYCVKLKVSSGKQYSNSALEAKLLKVQNMATNFLWCC